jgi:3,4-dihydroxy 2-butanone 4-phosphate synthase/GTP cyclohydrolase II
MGYLLVEPVAAETTTGTWKFFVFDDHLHGKQHTAMTMGDITPLTPVLVRVHSECLTGDVFHSLHCDCGMQLDAAMKCIAQEGTGVILYLRQEGRGIGLANKIRAYELQHAGLDTVEANRALGFGEDLREYGIGAQILKELGVGKMRLMTNNPKKVIGLEGYGLEIVEQIPLELPAQSEKQKKYLKTKKEKLHHDIRSV